MAGTAPSRPVRARPILEARKVPIEPSTDPLTQYTITEADAAGPFVEQIPSDIEQQATLESLAYTSIVEALAERFHASPALLKALNPTASFTAGSTITVPAVEPFLLPGRAGGTASHERQPVVAASIELSRDTQAVIARDASGGVLFYAPVTVGSEAGPASCRRLEDHWRVRSADLQLQPGSRSGTRTRATQRRPSRRGRTTRSGSSGSGSTRSTSVFTGAPEPSQIGRTQSHGCVRMTNWDAMRLAALVTEGTPVRLR